jgi:hypothetical protein
MSGIAARGHCASCVASIFRLHEDIGAGNSMLLHEVLDRQIRRLACFERRRSRLHTIVRDELASVVFRCCLFRSQSGCVLLLFDLFQSFFRGFSESFCFVVSTVSSSTSTGWLLSSGRPPAVWPMELFFGRSFKPSVSFSSAMGSKMQAIKRRDVVTMS